MKACLIPPIPHLSEFGVGGMHLILSHLLDDQRYHDHYQSRAAAGDYLILDNSCHEFGAGNGAEKLLQQAIDLGAKEVVCSDELFSSHGTARRTEDALFYFAEQKDRVSQLDLHFMMVPQGKSVDGWVHCLYELMRVYRAMRKEHPTVFRYPPVIGMSKDYEIWDGGLYNLIDTFLYPLIGSDDVQIHVLGWGRDLWKYRRIADFFPTIRSTDSAKPFVYAMSEICLDPADLIPYPKRPSDYFTRQMTLAELEAAHHNVAMFRQAVE